MAVQAEVNSAKMQKKKNKKNKSEKDAAPEFKTPLPPASTDSNMENKTAIVKIEDEQMEVAVKAFKKLLEINSTEKKADLFSEGSGEGSKMQLQIAGIKLPRVSEAQILKFRLPHSHTPDTKDVCLIVKDMEKGIRPDHENTVRHYENLLAEKGVKGITKVMALRELKVEYKTFESKRALCHLYDQFLADDRIIRFLPQFLGKAFYKRKKFPVQVSLTTSNLAKEISRALHTVTLPLKNVGSSSAVTFGLSSMSDTHLKENLVSLVRSLETKYPGGWVNVRSMHLLSSNCSLPLYMTMRGTHEVGMVRGLKRKSRGLVEDELSTVVGATVTVTPTGNVRVKRTKDPMWMEDDDITQELTNEVAEEGAEDEEEKKQIKKKDKPKKEKVDDDSEDEMEDEEMAYMQKVADEEEEMEKKLEASEDKLAEKLKDSVKESESDSEDEEEDVADDDAEAENLLSDGEDSDSEEELIMTNTGVDDDEDDKDEPPAKKPKKTKKNKVKSAEKAKSPKNQPQTKKSLKQKKFIEQKKKAKSGKAKK